MYCMCSYCLHPFMWCVCWHVCARGSMCQHSNGKAAHGDTKRTISSNITCTPETSICLAHLFPSLTHVSSPFALRVLSHTSSCSLQHTSSLFPSLSLSFPPVYLTPLFSPFLFVSVAFFTASVAFSACPVLHPLSCPRPMSHVCLIWFDI